MKFRDLVKSRMTLSKDPSTSLEGGFNLVIDKTTFDIFIEILIDNEKDAIQEAFYCGRFEYNNYEDSSSIYYKTTYEK